MKCTTCDRLLPKEGLHFCGTTGLQILQVAKGDVGKLIVKPPGLSCLQNTRDIKKPGRNV